AWRLLQGGFGLLALVVGMSIVALLPASSVLPAPWDALPNLPHPWIFASAWTGSVLALSVAVMRFRPDWIARGFTVAACACMMYVYLFFLPAVDIYRTQKPFA